jgi:cAMP-dependent protein kinase regulator
VNLFKALDKYEKIRLLDGLKVQWFKKGDTIIRTGDTGEMLYIVMEGHVECWQVIAREKSATKERMVGKLTSGDHFGELALMNPNGVRTLTVRCGSENTKLLALDRSSFNRILG